MTQEDSERAAAQLASDDQEGAEVVHLASTVSLFYRQLVHGQVPPEPATELTVAFLTSRLEGEKA